MSPEIKIRITVQGIQEGKPLEIGAKIDVATAALKGKKGKQAFLGLVLGGAEAVWDDIKGRGWVG